MKIASPVLFLVILTTLASCDNSSKKPDFHHTAVRVSDMTNSVNFYTEVFGLKVIDEIDTLHITGGEKDIITKVNLKFLSFSDYGHTLELIANNTPDSVFFSPHQHIGISVDDIEKTYAAALRLGATSVREPRLVFSKTKKVKNAFIKGIDGENIELMQWME